MGAYMLWGVGGEQEGLMGDLLVGVVGGTRGVNGGFICVGGGARGVNWGLHVMGWGGTRGVNGGLPVWWGKTFIIEC